MKNDTDDNPQKTEDNIKIEKKEDIDKSGYCFHYAGFELLLCNKDVLVKFSTEQQKEIFRRKIRVVVKIMNKKDKSLKNFK